MKLALATALLVLLAGTTMYAQEQDKDKPAQQEEKKQEPAAKEHEQPKAQEQQKAQDQQKTQHQAQEQQKAKQTEKEKSDAAKQQQQAAHQQQQQAAKQQQVARQDHAQNTQAQRDGGNGNARRISEQDFHEHFGREHTFRVARNDDRRFNYGGYYWVYNDPWPSGWAYTDAVYVDEIDGEYYLIDPVHPGVRLMIVVAS
ncbi:MAG TPA: hypothetical protein VN933_14795 [Candidatus Eremiobacteraceae bacterium]|nr:hypothetical protein [Candidatus Eremiobacteraceae bacterium]